MWSISWARRRDDWLRKPKELYGDMGSSPESVGKEIRIGRTPIQLKENYPGTCDAEELTGATKVGVLPKQIEGIWPQRS